LGTITLTKEEAQDMVNSGDMDKQWLLAGYEYQDEDDEEQIEFRGDMYLFGGMPSVRRDRE
jgi:hypothetical protein